jgi:DNA polymerase-3 subunit epsilon
MKTSNFVAIDFETMTAEQTSACAIGLVKVLGGTVHQAFYSLINPVPDDRDMLNTAVHGITPDMVANAPTYAQLFPLLESFIQDLPIVCHNRGADINIMQRCMDYYGLTGIDTANNYCTFEMTGQSLTACCKQYGIPMLEHHNALDDALACAKVFLACQGEIVATTFRGGIAAAMASAAAKKFERSTLDPLDDDQVQNKDTVFFHANVVITGTFAAYPDRNALGKQLQSLGADINTSISGKTTVVVMGQGAGPSKIKKIEELRAKGHNIRIIYEEELKQILDYGKE